MSAGRVVITGGAGFVGSSLCDRFLQDGWRVMAVDNLCTGRRDNVAHLQGNSDFELRVADVCEPLTIDGTVEAVLHFASPASPFDYLARPIETLRVGSEGTLRMLDLAVQKKARFLMASTSEIYGDPLEHPQRESYLGNVSSVGPRSVYDEAKRFAEAATMAYRRTYGLDTRLIRIFNTYGPRMKAEDGRVVTAFLAQGLRGEPLPIFGDGSQTRSFCYVDDLVDGILRVFGRGDGEPYNLGNPVEFTILELAREVEALLGPQRIEFHALPADDPKQRQPDITRAVGELGWEPAVNLREGLARTLVGMRRTLGLV